MRLRAACLMATMFAGPFWGAQAQKVVVEDGVEQPAQVVLEAPMGSGGVHELLCRQGRGGEVVTPGDACLAVAFDHRLDHADHGQRRKTRLSGKATAGCEPVDVPADIVATDLDAPMVAVGGFKRVENVFRFPFEVETHILG